MIVRTHLILQAQKRKKNSSRASKALGNVDLNTYVLFGGPTTKNLKNTQKVTGLSAWKHHPELVGGPASANAQKHLGAAC